MSHFIEVCQSFNLFVLLLKEHLYEEHLSFLLDQIPAILSILRPLNRHVKASIFCHIDLVRDIWIDSQCCRLYISFTKLAEAALSCRPILLPDLQFLIRLALTFFTNPLLILEREYTVIAWVSERIRVLLKAE